jgi:formiminotetrahydrofolate cyclodeaminase
MMELISLAIDDYLDLVASDAPAPGGGSASALMGAQAIGLAAMVIRLTLGREKYADYFSVCEETLAEAEELRAKLTRQIDRDTESFAKVSAAYKMPKSTDEEICARKEAIAAGTLFATAVPFETLQLGFAGLRCLEELVGRSNPNCTSDLGVAALGLLACVRGAWLNVLINLGGIKDKEKADAFLTEGKTIVEQAEALAESLYREICDSL